MDDDKYTVQDIVWASINQEPAEVENAFSDVILDKIGAALEAKRQEMAKTWAQDDEDEDYVDDDVEYEDDDEDVEYEDDEDEDYEGDDDDEYEEVEDEDSDVEEDQDEDA